MSTPNLICCSVAPRPIVTMTFFEPPLTNCASAPFDVSTEACRITFAQPFLAAMSSWGSGWLITLACAAVVVFAAKSML